MREVADAACDLGEVEEIAHTQGRTVVGVRLGKTHAPDEPRRAEERERVQHEDGVPAERNCGQSADGRADRKVDRPGGGGDLFGRCDIGDDRRAARLKQPPANGFRKEQQEQQPQRTARAHQQHGEHDHGARQIGEDHHLLAAEAVIDDARGRGGEGLRQHLHQEREGEELRAAGEFQQEAEDGDGVEPVAQLADDLREPQQPEIAVGAEQARVGG